MLRKDRCRGFVHTIRLYNGQRNALFWENTGHKHMTLFYAFNTRASMLIDEKDYKLDEKDSLMIEGDWNGSSPDISMVSTGDGVIVMADVELL